MKSWKSKLIPLKDIEFDLNNALTFGIKFLTLRQEAKAYTEHSTCRICFGEGYYGNDEGFFTACPTCPREKRFIFGGRYAIQQQIGSGTFSTTFRAVDRFSCLEERLVAIKVLNRNFTYIGINEVQVLQHLKLKDPKQHFPIVRFLDKFFWKQQYLCLVEEFLECEALESPLVPFSPVYACNSYTNALNFSAYLSQKATISQLLHKFRKVAFQACKFLVFLQANQLIHADLKVDNVMFVHKHALNAASPLAVRFIDFGNAVHFDNVSGYFIDFEIQSLAYRAPEVVFGCEFDEKIDVWSIGCCLFAIWTGKELFEQVDDEHSLCKSFVNLFGNDFAKGKVLQRGKFLNSFRSTLRIDIADESSTKLSKMLLASGLGEEGQDLICRMLHPDPTERIAPKDCILHPFFEDFVDPILYCIA